MTKRRFDVSRSTINGATAMLALMIYASSAIAGQQDAGIDGTVTDDSGAVLPGLSLLRRFTNR